MSVTRIVTSLVGCALAVGWLLPIRTAGGPVEGVSIEAKDLTASEIAQVRRLARPTGKNPWLIYGFRYGRGPKSAPRHTTLAVYLQPDVENDPLRRGRVLHVELSAPAAAGRMTPARIESTANYAQVVVPGRRPDDLSGPWDVHGPFRVEGEFDDETLLRVVALIRSSPEGPPLPDGGPPAKVNGSLAISHVRRIPNGVEVRLNQDGLSGEYVTLEERNGRLVVVKHGLWIV